MTSTEKTVIGLTLLSLAGGALGVVAVGRRGALVRREAAANDDEEAGSLVSRDLTAIDGAFDGQESARDQREVRRATTLAQLESAEAQLASGEPDGVEDTLKQVETSLAPELSSQLDAACDLISADDLHGAREYVLAVTQRVRDR